MSRRDVVTDDGVELALHRLRAHRDGRPAALLVHGAFASHTLWLRSVDSGPGLAHFLGARGLDVWLADLRDHGASAREPGSHRWRFEDWVLRDAPALVARVKEETGGAPLGWVGHSAGGAVALCWLARLQHAAPLASVVTFGTPGPGRVGLVRTALAALTAGIAKALGRFPARALRMGSEDGGAGILADWMMWNVRGRWVGSDGFDYCAALERVETPLLAVAGRGDRLFAPPESCREVVDRLGAARKELLVVGPRLSHRGMLLDPRARDRCWPRVAEWLKQTLTPA